MSLAVLPLANVVLFPRTEISLRVDSEPQLSLVRYALRSTGALAVAMPARGHDLDCDPPVGDVGCAGLVSRPVKRPRGGLSVSIVGLQRVRFLEEVRLDDRVRAFRCKPLADRLSDPSSIREAESCLRSLAHRVATFMPEVRDHIIRAIGDVDEGGGGIADQVASRLVPNPRARQTILEALDIGVRLDLTIREVAEVCLRVDPTCRKGGAVCH